jgi:hypothetical protein
VTLRDGQRVDGELIAVTRNRRLLVLSGKRDALRGWIGQRLVKIRVREIMSAELRGYDGDSYWGAGVVGMAPLMGTLIAPGLWLIATAAENNALDEHRVFRYTGNVEVLAAFARWARFPQGPPAGLRVVPRRAGAGVGVSGPARPRR